MSTHDDGPASADDDLGGQSRSGRRSNPGLIAAIAAGCLALGALGGVAIASVLDDDEPEATRADSPLAVYARTSFDPTPGPGDTTDPTTTETVDTETTETTDTETTTDTTTTPTDSPVSADAPPAALVALQARIPAADQPCRYQVLEGFDDMVLVCAGQGVVSLYETYWSVDQLRAVYAEVVRDAGVTGTSGEDSCPSSLPSEQEIASGGLTTGRLVCLEHEGRPVLAWTSEPLGTLGVAFGTAGSAMSDLYAWWEQTPRPAFTEDELAFYAAIPEDQRSSCDSDFIPFQFAVCSASNPADPTQLIRILYSEMTSADELASSYESHLDAIGISRGTGRCPDEPPAEAEWQQSGRPAGRVTCRVIAGADLPELNGLAEVWWTTDALTLRSFALAPEGMSLAELWTWWMGQSGPIYPKQ